MGTGYGTATAEVATALESTGLPVTTNAQNLTLPGAWLTPAGVDYDLMDAGKYTGTWVLFLVTRNNDPLVALDDLSTMAGKVRDLFPAFKAEAITVTLANHSPDPLPAFRINIEMSVS